MRILFMLTNKKNKVGLVLTGGGAKGAYHVGAIRAIAELGVPIHAVSGASIGALNGAVVATAGNMTNAYKNLNGIWRALGDDKAIGISKDLPKYLTMLAATGVAFRALPIFSAGVGIVAKITDVLGIDMPNLDAHLLDDTQLVKLLEECTSPEALRNGLPLYVSVYETEGVMEDLFNVLKAIVRLGNTNDSEFFHVQSLSDREMQEVLMGSAALPVLFKAREVNNKRYTDGGQGDWYGVGGNTPVKPLVEAGCDTIIVVHLCDGSPWDRNLYKNVNIIEVRPQSTIQRGNAVSDVLGFDNERISSWIDQGYEDATYSLERIFNTVQKYNRLEASHQFIESSFQKHEQVDIDLKEVMKRII